MTGPHPRVRETHADDEPTLLDFIFAIAGLYGILVATTKCRGQARLGYLTKWLKDPASQRPTAHMPKIGLSDAEAKTLAAYLGSLK